MTWNKQRNNKYGAKRIERFGKIYDSQMEADDALSLHQLQKQGKISDLQEQVRFPITINGINIGYSRVDFRFRYKNFLVWYETKGFHTDTYKLKRKCIEALLHGDTGQVYIVNYKDLTRFFNTH